MAPEADSRSGLVDGLRIMPLMTGHATDVLGMVIVCREVVWVHDRPVTVSENRYANSRLCQSRLLMTAETHILAHGRGR